MKIYNITDDTNNIRVASNLTLQEAITWVESFDDKKDVVYTVWHLDEQYNVLIDYKSC